jgi:surface protein
MKLSTEVFTRFLTDVAVLVQPQAMKERGDTAPAKPKSLLKTRFKFDSKTALNTKTSLITTMKLTKKLSFLWLALLMLVAKSSSFTTPLNNKSPPRATSPKLLQDMRHVPKGVRLMEQQLSSSNSRNLQTTCTGDLVPNACANCCGFKFTTKADLTAAVNGYPGNSGTYGVMNCWDVSDITNMVALFYLKQSFNELIECWDVSKVTDMGNMFDSATNFNQDIAKWNVSKVNRMNGMFWAATKFNQNLCAWYNKITSAPNVANMFAGSACPITANPDLTSKASFCRTCAAPLQTTPSTAEWAVSPNATLLQDLMYTSSGVSFTLNFKTGKFPSKLQLLSQDCTTNISALTYPVFAYDSPVVNAINAKEQSVSYAVRCNITSLKRSNIYDQSNSTNSTIVGNFCARVDLLDSSNNSVSFLKNPLLLGLNVTKGLNFSVTGMSAAETADGTSVQGSVGLDSAISACVCDTVTFKCNNPVPTLGPFSILSVCVYSLNATAQIDQVNSLRVTQGGTSASLDSIINAVPSSLTTLTKSSDGKTVCIQTQLYSMFFDGLTSSNKDQRKLSAQGNVQIKLSDGSRRLIYLDENTVGLGFVRNTKQRESTEEAYQSKTSSFMVDQINIDENPGIAKGPNVEGGTGLIVVLGALAIVASIVLLAIAAKKKWTRKEKRSLSQV